MEEKKDLRLKEQKIGLTNQNIIELAYLTKDMIEHCCGKKLSFEGANCYLNCFYTSQRLLRGVDSEYLKKHQSLGDFYREDRRLSNDWDRLYFAEFSV